MEHIERPKGSKASCGVWRGDSGLLSRPCRKRRASSRDDGVIFCFFSSWGATCGVSLELRWGTHGSSRVSREVQSQFELRGEPGIALESRQGNRASRQFEGESQGLSQVVAGNHGFPELVTLTPRSLSWCLWEVRNTVELGGASWDSTGVGAMEEGLILS